ncbi:3-phosphoshikimate 1-carboxyvinyltransferase [Cupriavidus sp. IDO]|uniref:3-phosphoshikimate 1-carboxyvinyltransferase n=1 Tax=Cupriavidus sp. IDO TaxID=1539142 RepID=UPI0007C63738|nr:3-phosphoshikimate 1-carboxyvinyltransferase [Cupriavidus sp. IDO]
MGDLILGPFTNRARGVVRLPGSKSISNRVLLLAALAKGETRLRNLLESDDTRVMLDALRRLGVHWNRDGEDLVVNGTDSDFPVKSADLFVGNSGTATRSLAAVLAMQGGHYSLSGVPRMHERPIGNLVNSLRQIGASIHYLASDGYPPLRVEPAGIRAVDPIQVSGEVSSQFLTALLMALPLTSSPAGFASIEITSELISRPYIALTLNLLLRFGIAVEREGWSGFRVPTNTRYLTPGELTVEGDASSASYFLAAGAIGGGSVRVVGAGTRSVQGDIMFAQALAEMGATVEMGEDWMEVSRGEGDQLHGIELDCNHIPDAAMTLAMVALFARGSTTLTNIASWRVKETDRLAAMATELRKLGAGVEEGPDYLRIAPPEVWLSPEAGIDTYDDHRMAMCFSLAAFGPASVRVNDYGCVRKTFPQYFDVLSGLTASTCAVAAGRTEPAASDLSVCGA